VAFLIEATGERIGCLLNPESLTIARLAGIRPRSSVAGPLTGAELRDDPLLYTGGGVTEFTLDLLFDVSLAGSSIETDDVRVLTAPFWDLAENATADRLYGRPPQVVFVWGKAWSIPAVVTAVAERFEQFTEAGFPRRSWLRMRLRRTDPPESEPPGVAPYAGTEEEFDSQTLLDLLGTPEAPAEPSEVYETVGDGLDMPGRGERLDEIAYRRFGDASWWRLLANFNRIDDPLRIPAGSLIRLPFPAHPPESP
jgi:hypothetical protein